MKLSEAENKTFGQIKNIIFDWGGVITNIDFNATIFAFKKFGLNEMDNLYTKFNQNDLFVELETGKISPAQFRNRLRQKIGRPVSDVKLDEAWNAMMLDIPSERMELLNQLRKNYRIFLLSNTNQIHVEAYRHYLREQFGLNSFSEIFEKVYYSFEIGLRKPGTEIFQFVLKDSQLAPEETLFIDDTEVNIQSAEQTGITSFFLQERDIREIF
ncbi:MAG: HAD family phosphatase [Bacteroidales bacterium]|nr:HAD family phosphatase [Bacteroidales bacterium]